MHSSPSCPIPLPPQPPKDKIHPETKDGEWGCGDLRAGLSGERRVGSWVRGCRASTALPGGWAERGTRSLTSGASSPTAGLTEAPLDSWPRHLQPHRLRPSSFVCCPCACPSAPLSVLILGNQLQRVGETGPVTAVSSVLLLVLRYKSRFHAGVPRGS